MPWVCPKVGRCSRLELIGALCVYVEPFLTSHCISAFKFERINQSFSTQRFTCSSICFIKNDKFIACNLILKQAKVHQKQDLMRKASSIQPNCIKAVLKFNVTSGCACKSKLKVFNYFLTFVIVPLTSICHQIMLVVSELL